jgi:hypothetical protein
MIQHHLPRRLVRRDGRRAVSGAELPFSFRGGTHGMDPSCPTGSGLAGFFAAGGHAGSRFSARQRQLRR